ncbi:hypothetical protein PTKIN_Ptkin04bG0112000 [Pterospermum kingtungense]
MATMDTDVLMVPIGEASSSIAPSSSTKKPKCFEIKKWNAVTLWAQDIVVDNYVICKNHIMDLCIECQANQSFKLQPPFSSPEPTLAASL